MTRTKKFMFNASSAALMQVITMLAGLITPRIMLTCYGSEINGLVSSIAQFVSYFNIVEAGLTSAVVYALYKPLAQKDMNVISGVVVASKKFYYQAGCAFMALVIGMAIIYPQYIRTDKLGPTMVCILVFVSAVGGALDFFALAKYSAILTADQRGYIKNIGTMIQTIMNTLIVVVMSYLGANIVILKIMALSSLFLRSAFLFIYVKRKYYFLDEKAKPNYVGLEKRWSAFYLQLLQIVHN